MATVEIPALSTPLPDTQSAPETTTAPVSRRIEKGISGMTIGFLRAALGDPTGRARTLAVHMLSSSPSTREALRIEIGQPQPDLTGGRRLDMLKILDEAEHAENEQMLRAQMA